MERVRQENERLLIILQQEREEMERREYISLEKEKADRMAQEKLEWERWEREERNRVKEKKQRDDYIRRLRNVSPDSLHTLRELIRAKYALDVEIWGLRDVRRPDRHIAVAKMEKADAILHEIYAMVNAWEDTQTSWTGPEWEQAMEVKRRLLADGKRWWLVSGPPWDDVENDSLHVTMARR